MTNRSFIHWDSYHCVSLMLAPGSLGHIALPTGRCDFLFFFLLFLLTFLFLLLLPAPLLSKVLCPGQPHPIPELLHPICPAPCSALHLASFVSPHQPHSRRLLYLSACLQLFLVHVNAQKALVRLINKQANTHNQI